MVSKEQTHLPWVGKRCGEVKMSRHYGVAMGLCRVGPCFFKSLNILIKFVAGFVIFWSIFWLVIILFRPVFFYNR